jgi:hypothetical protein
VNSWPLVAGDEIDTLSAPVLLVLQNGKKIQVSAHSRVKLTGTAKQTTVAVESGRIVELGSGPIGKGAASPRPLAISTGGGPHSPMSHYQ